MPKYTSQREGAQIARPRSFWAGLVLTLVGVGLHVPMFLDMRHMEVGAPAGSLPVVGMPGSGGVGVGMSGVAFIAMWTGMAALVVGSALAVRGLLHGRPCGSATGNHRVVASTAGRLSPAQLRLTAVLSLAMVVDIMKPATIAFILPGMRAEYHLTVAQSSAMPVSALTGTVLGSLGWGYLGDRVGRRATIMLSAVVFVATTVCAAMPTFTGNLVMCFLMGAAAGGLLPVGYAMMAESIPAARRSFVMVLQAGLASTAAYLCTSGLATVLIPRFGWRVMWFTHLPLALLILLMNRWLPESPRFLLQRGQVAEAEAVLRLYGMRLVPASGPARTGRALSGRQALAVLFGRRCLGRTVVVCLYALSWGGINWGFMTYLPVLLGPGPALGGSGTSLLFVSSLLAVPGTALVAFCYARWSGRRTMVLFGGVTAAALGVLAVTAGGGGLLVLGPLMLLITGTSGVIAILAPYTAEIYPTAVRGAGSGVVAACTKAGGMFGPPLLAAVIAAWPGMRMAALVVAAPMLLATVSVLLWGRESAGIELDELDDDFPSIQVHANLESVGASGK